MLMRYSGIPQMLSVCYMELDDVQADTMDAVPVFAPGSSGVDIGLSK
jgi:hypothetical protein